ncbi:MAG: hypothetical protein WC947_06350 [Elusimicrobiota bacterium]
MKKEHDKSHRASASQFFVAAELCRRGLVANVTLGNCPNVDILCTNKSATDFVHIQVKTFLPGSHTCMVGIKSEKIYNETFFWVIAGIPNPTQSSDFEYYIIPSKDMAKNMQEQHEVWVAKPGKNGRKHDASTKCRGLVLPPGKNHNGWKIDKYLNRWDLITNKIKNV